MSAKRLKTFFLVLIILGCVGVILNHFFGGQFLRSQRIEQASQIKKEKPITDLTEVVFVSKETSCQDFVGLYKSEVTNAISGRIEEGSLNIEADGEICLITTNQVPNHDFGTEANFARTEFKPLTAKFFLPTTPQKARETTELNIGPNAIMLNGVTWESKTPGCFGVGDEELGAETEDCGIDNLDNPWRYNTGSNLNDLELDTNNGHLGEDDQYQYHANPISLYEDDCTLGASPVIGFAADGFPIYGPCIADENGELRKARSSYVLKEGQRQPANNYGAPIVAGNVSETVYNGQFVGDFEYQTGAGDLDECNGMEVDGQYGYYVTDQYPYVMGCYVGTPSKTFQ